MSRPVTKADVVAYLSAMRPALASLDVRPMWMAGGEVWVAVHDLRVCVHAAVVARWLDRTAGTWAGPLADECGRAPAGGDNDFDGDVPEVAWRDGPGWGYRWRGRVYWFSSVGRADERRRVWGEPSPALLRFYWPRDCDGNGADDIPRDCLEAM